jgi:cell division transport system ATP-binding protein
MIRRKVPEILSLVWPQREDEQLCRTRSPAASSSASRSPAPSSNHPPLLLADEPTGNIDPETAVGIMQLLVRIYRTGRRSSSPTPTTGRW